MRVFKYDGEGRTVAVVELDVEALVDSLLDEIANRCYERSVAKVSLPDGRRKEVRWHRRAHLFMLDHDASRKAGFLVGELLEQEAPHAG